MVAFASAELAARAFVYPSEQSAGVLMGRQLPPFAIVPANSPEDDRQTPLGIVVDGQNLTHGDLWGYQRRDNLLGYTTLENSASVNQWWQSNNVGARSRTDTNPEIPKGKKRTLIFGESFGESTRVRQEEAWSSVLESIDPQREVVNLAVDGYSMGQAYLRYLSLKDVLGHSGSLMMFVPAADLWRDVNTIRDLYEPWGLTEVQPRFIMVNGRIRLVRSPYSRPSDIYTDNRGGLSVRLRNHLRQYDRYYFQSLYEEPPIIGYSMMYKLAARVLGRLERETVDRSLMAPASEAMEVSHAIFLDMQADETKIGAEFALLILPVKEELDEYSDYSEKWRAMVDFICVGLKHCIDLAPALLEIPRHDRDSGYDGTHYGPIMNRRIGEAVHTELVHQGL
jgi:hypothetical protein